MSLGVDQAGAAQRLHVAQNTFFSTHAWLALERCSLDQPDLRIANNLILQSQEIRLTGQDLTPVAPRWFHNNWWERSDGFNQIQAQQVAAVKDEVQLVSRDPASNDFLRPAPSQLPAPDLWEDRGACGGCCGCCLVMRSAERSPPRAGWRVLPWSSGRFNLAEPFW